MKNRKQPEVRFSGFTDDWEERKGNEIFKSLVEKGKETLPVLSVTQDNGVVYREDVGIDIKYDPKTLNTYKVIYPGNFVISLRSFQGGFELSDKLGITSPAYTVFESKNVEKHDNLFWKTKFKTFRFIESLKTVTFGIRDGKTISFSEFGDLKLFFPKLNEQQKIGSFFKQLDNTITLHQRKLELLKEQKKGFLQKMFPKTGANTPEVRFSGFTDDWKERKFEDLLDSKDGVRRGPFGSALKKEFFVDNSDYVVYEQQNAIYDNYHTRYKITKEKFDELSKFKLTPGDFIMSGAGTIGRISRVPADIQLGVFNQALIRFRLNVDITDSEYFIQFVRADFMQKNLTGANPGSAITNLVPMSEVKMWEINVPKLEEQQKIGQFFKQLDDTIALHQRELELLKETKKGFLQKMFV